MRPARGSRRADLTPGPGERSHTPVLAQSTSSEGAVFVGTRSRRAGAWVRRSRARISVLGDVAELAYVGNGDTGPTRDELR